MSCSRLKVIFIYFQLFSFLDRAIVNIIILITFSTSFINSFLWRATPPSSPVRFSLSPYFSLSVSLFLSISLSFSLYCRWWIAIVFQFRNSHRAKNAISSCGWWVRILDLEFAICLTLVAQLNWYWYCCCNGHNELD